MLSTYPITRNELKGIVERCLANSRVTDSAVELRVSNFARRAEHVAFGVSYDRPDCRCPLSGAYGVKALTDIPDWTGNEPLSTFANLFDMCGYARTGVTFGELVVTDD